MLRQIASIHRATDSPFWQKARRIAAVSPKKGVIEYRIAERAGLSGLWGQEQGEVPARRRVAKAWRGKVVEEVGHLGTRWGGGDALGARTCAQHGVIGRVAEDEVAFARRGGKPVRTSF